MRNTIHVWYNDIQIIITMERGVYDFAKKYFNDN
jgi:hypothetical protein